MRTLTSFVTGAALLIAAGSIGCLPDPDDVFETIANTTPGDGDGDTTGDGDGDSAGDGDGDGDTGCAAGNIEDPCDENCPCTAGLTCNSDGVCSLGGGDGDGDGDGDPGGMCTSYDPMMCAPPGMVIGVQNVPGSFCACACTTNADCPSGPPGTQGGCALMTPQGMVFCGLICNVQMDACPEGSTCKSAGQMDPNVGLCTYP